MMNEGFIKKNERGEGQGCGLVILPLLPGKAEAWRRFVQELQELEGQEWAAWRERVGVDWLRIWVRSAPQGSVVFVQAGFRHPDWFMQPLVDEREPFDRWVREQILALHGVDLRLLQAEGEVEVVLES